MVWYKPSTWFKPKAPPSGGVSVSVEPGQKTINIKTGQVTTTTVTPSYTKTTVTSPTPKKRGGGSGGGGGISVTPTPSKVTPTTKQIFPTVEPIVKTPTIQKSTLTPISKAEQAKKAAQISYYERPTISAATPSKRKTIVQATKETAGLIGRDVKTFFTGRPGEEYIGISKWTEPFAFVGPIESEAKGERIVSTKFGTIAPGEDPYLRVKKIDIERDIQRTAEISGRRQTYEKGITDYGKELQSQINQNLISVGEATELIKPRVKEADVSFRKDVESAYKRYPDIITPEMELRRVETVKKGVELIPDIAVIGTSIAIPGIAPELTAGYFGGKALYYGTKKPTISEAFGEIGRELKFEKGKFEIAETPLTEEYKGYRKQAQISLGIALGGVAAKQVSLGKEITALRMKEGISSKTLSLRREIYQKDGETFFSQIARQKTPFFKSQVIQKYPVFEKGEGEFIMGVAKGKAKYQVLDFWKQIQGAKQPYIRGTVDFIAGGEGVTGATIMRGAELPSIQTSFGTGYVSTEKELVTFGFGGISKDYGTIVKSFGGRATSLKVYTEPIIKIGDAGKVVGFDTSITRAVAKVPIKEFGLTFKLPTGAGVGEGIGGIGFQGGTAKSSQQFLQSLYSPSAGFGPSVSKIVQQSISLPSQKGIVSFAPSIAATSAFAGMGQYERTGGGLMPSISEQKLYGFTMPSVMKDLIKVTKVKPKAAGAYFPSFRGELIQVPTTENIFKYGYVPSQMPKLKQETKQLLRAKIPPFAPTFPFKFGVPFTPGFSFVPPVFPFPRFGLLDYEKKGRAKPKKFRGRYAPTISAIGLGITTPKIPKLYKKGFGALMQRGVLAPAPRRKGKKRKIKDKFWSDIL